MHKLLADLRIDGEYFRVPNSYGTILEIVARATTLHVECHHQTTQRAKAVLDEPSGKRRYIDATFLLRAVTTEANAAEELVRGLRARLDAKLLKELDQIAPAENGALV